MHKHILFYQRRLGISTVERRERKERRCLRFSVGFPGNALTASRASVATLAIFAPRGGRKNACWGASPNPADFGTLCPEVAALCAFYLRLVTIAPSLILRENRKSRGAVFDGSPDNT